MRGTVRDVQLLNPRARAQAPLRAGWHLARVREEASVAGISCRRRGRYAVLSPQLEDHGLGELTDGAKRRARLRRRSCAQVNRDEFAISRE